MQAVFFSRKTMLTVYDVKVSYPHSELALEHMLAVISYILYIYNVQAFSTQC